MWRLLIPVNKCRARGAAILRGCIVSTTQVVAAGSQLGNVSGCRDNVGVANVSSPAVAMQYSNYFIMYLQWVPDTLCGPRPMDPTVYFHPSCNDQGDPVRHTQCITALLFCVLTIKDGIQEQSAALDFPGQKKIPRFPACRWVLIYD